MKNTSLLLSFVCLITISSFAQAPPNNEENIYKDSDGKLYVNRNMPVYLSVSTKADGSDRQLLEGPEPKYTTPMYLDTEGYNSIRSPWKVDPETGETVYPKQEVIFAVYADSKPPISKLDYVAEKVVKNVNGVSLKNGEVSISSNDETAGVAAIYYSIDGASFKTYASPIKLNEEKSYLLKYYAVDHVGNAEEVKEVNIDLDLTAPKTSLAIEGDLKEEILSSRSKITLDAVDNNEIEKVFYTIDEGKTYQYTKPINLSYLKEGEHAISYYSVDKVGNTEEIKSYSFFVDTSAPRVIDEIIGNTFIVNGKEYYSGRTKLKLVAMDNKSGVKELRYSVNGGEFKLYEEPFYLTQAGSLNIEVLAIDNVNNRARTTEFSDKSNTRSYVDLSGPSLSYSMRGPSFKVKDTVYVSKDTKFLLSGKDSEAGFKEIDYQIGASTLQTYEESFSVEKEGFHNITFNGYDNLDNSNTKNILVMVDNTGPEVYNRFSIDANKACIMVC
ncbi:MAG: chitobiase/beta-hexosaminidase C-terminal domain-containing protein [Bacteroidota bacterium]